MHRLIHTIALSAAALVLAVGAWQGWSLWATGKRAALAYLGFFFLGSLLALAVRAVPLFDPAEPAAGDGPPDRKPGRRQRKPAAGA